MKKKTNEGVCIALFIINFQILKIISYSGVVYDLNLEIELISEYNVINDKVNLYTGPNKSLFILSVLLFYIIYYLR